MATNQDLVRLREKLAVVDTAMNDYVTREVELFQQITQRLNRTREHLMATDNPHSVTKAQVGLGQVENYPIATSVQAKEGTAEDVYMTPLRTTEAITVLAEALVQVFDEATADLN